MSHATVSTWLKAAGIHAGVALSLGEDGHCRMRLGDGSECVVEVPAPGEWVFFYVPVAPVPDDAAAAARALKSALALNLFGLETQGATFAYDERTGHILLTASARVDALDEALFCDLLGGFAQAGIAAKALYEARQA